MRLTSNNGSYFDALKILSDTPKHLQASFINQFSHLSSNDSFMERYTLECLSEFSNFTERQAFMEQMGKFLKVLDDQSVAYMVVNQICKIPVKKRQQVLEQASHLLKSKTDYLKCNNILNCLIEFDDISRQKFTTSLSRLLSPLKYESDKSSIIKKIAEFSVERRLQIVEQAVCFFEPSMFTYVYEEIIDFLNTINEDSKIRQNFIPSVSKLFSLMDGGDYQSSFMKTVKQMPFDKRDQIIEQAVLIVDLLNITKKSSAVEKIVKRLAAFNSDSERDGFIEIALEITQLPNMDQDTFLDVGEVLEGISRTDQRRFIDSLSSILLEFDSSFDRRQVLLPMKSVVANNRLSFVQFLNENQVEKREDIAALAIATPDLWLPVLETLREDRRKYSSHSVKEVKANQVYQKLDNQAVRVNRAALSKWKLPEIQMAPYTADQMQKSFANIVKGLNLTDATRPDYVSAALLEDSSVELKGTANRDKFHNDILPKVSGFLKSLWNVSLSGKETSGWQMYDDNKPAFKKALSYILEQMTQADGESRMMLLNQLVNGLLHCPTGQKEAVDTVVQSLVSQTLVNAETFQQKLDQFLAIKKNEAFRRTMISGNNTQNVHILSYYHEKLGKTLGLSSSLGEYKERIGRMGHDPFSGYEGNALQAFYQTFNPSYLTDAFHSHVQTKKDFTLQEELETLKRKVRAEKDNAKKEQLSTQLNALKQKYTQITRTDRPFTATMVYNDLMERGKLPTDSSDGWEKYFSDDPIMSTDSFELTKAGAKQYLIDSGLLLEKAK